MQHDVDADLLLGPFPGGQPARGALNHHPHPHPAAPHTHHAGSEDDEDGGNYYPSAPASEPEGGCQGGPGNGHCELDWTTDPVETLGRLRACLLERGSAVLTVLDSRPSLLLDAVGLLHLLNQVRA